MPIDETEYKGRAKDPVTGQEHEIHHLPVMPEWEPGIYMYEFNDKLVTGINGIDNLQAQQLANRTEFLKQEVEKRGAVTFEITIPATGWIKNLDDRTGYPYQINIHSDVIKSTMIPQAVVLTEYNDVAKNARLCKKIKTVDGTLCVRAASIPKSEIKAQLTLFGVAMAISGGDVIPGGDTEPVTDEDKSGIIDNMYPDDAKN